MTRRVHHEPFVLRPADDLADARPDLRRAAAELAQAYRAMGDALGRPARAGEADAGRSVAVVDDKGLGSIGAALWSALTAADPTLPDRLAAARAAAGTYLLPLVV